MTSQQHSGITACLKLHGAKLNKALLKRRMNLVNCRTLIIFYPRMGTRSQLVVVPSTALRPSFALGLTELLLRLYSRRTGDPDLVEALDLRSDPRDLGARCILR